MELNEKTIVRFALLFCVLMAVLIAVIILLIRHDYSQLAERFSLRALP